MTATRPPGRTTRSQPGDRGDLVIEVVDDGTGVDEVDGLLLEHAAQRRAAPSRPGA